MDFSQFFAEEEIRYFKNFRDYIFTSLVKYKKELKFAADEYEKTDKDSDYAESVAADYQNIIFEINETRQIMIRSFLISIFSFIENETNFLCDEIKKSKMLSISFRDMKGSGIGRSILFLKKIGGIGFPANDKQKEKFLHYKGLRDVAVHANGFFGEEEAKQKFGQASKKYGDYKINSIGEVTYTKAFVNNLLTFTKAFINEVHSIRKKLKV